MNTKGCDRMARELDDVYIRQLYKDAMFDGKKTTIDEYTGEKIYYGNKKDAIRKHSVSKTSDIDHIVPIDVVKRLYPDLSPDQQRLLVNNLRNYAITNSSLNRKKGGFENHEYLLKQLLSGEPEDIKTTINMIVKEIDSHAVMGFEAAEMRIYNAKTAISQNVTQLTSQLPTGLKETGTAFADGAKNALIDSTIPLVVESVNNLIQVAKGEKEFKEAACDVGKTALEIAVTGGVNKMIDLIPEGHMKQIVNVAVIVKDSAFKYLNGEITGHEFIEEVGVKGAQMAAGIIAGEVGKEIGLIVGSAIGTTILPGIGSIAGAAIGQIVGQVVCSMIVTATCGLIVTARDTLKHMDDYKKKESQIRRLTSNALAEMENQRNIIKNIVKTENEKWDKTVDEAFNIINSSFDSEISMSESFARVTSGLDTILSLFGKQVMFNSADEYRSQLDTVLVI